MSIVATLEEIAQEVGFKDERAFGMLKGIRDKSPQEQAAIAQRLIDEGLLLSGSVGALQYEIDAVNESQPAEVGTAAELPAAEMTAQDLEKPKETPKETPKAEPENFGDMIANSTALRALFPRTYARLDQGETGALGAALSGALDLPSSIGRGAVALGKLATGSLGERTGENFAKEMGKIEKSPETRGIGGLVESIARDPLTPISLGAMGAGTVLGKTVGAEALGRIAASKLIPEAVTGAQKIGQAALAGTISGVAPAAGVSVAQLALGEKTPEQAAMQTGAGAVGGALGGAVGQSLANIFKRNTAPVIDGKFRVDRAAGENVLNPQEIEDASIEAVARLLGIGFEEAKTLPPYMRNVAVNAKPEERAQLVKFLQQAATEKMAAGLEQKITPKMLVAEKWDKGIKAMDNFRRDLGKEMGAIEASTLPDSRIDIAPILQDFNENLAEKMGFGIFQNSDGSYYVSQLRSGSSVDPEFEPQLNKIVEIVGRHGNVVTGEQLRNIEKAVRSKLNNLSTTMYDSNDTPYDAAAEGLYKSIGERVRNAIRQSGGEEAAQRYAQTRKDYAQLLGDKDYLQRRLGQKSKGEYEVDGEMREVTGSARGANMVERLITGIADGRTIDIANRLKPLIGEDLYTQAAMAKYAEEAMKTLKAGRGSEGMKKGSKLLEFGKEIMGKGTSQRAGRAFEAVARGTGDRPARKGASRGAAVGAGAAMTLPEIFLRPMLLNSEKK